MASNKTRKPFGSKPSKLRNVEEELPTRTPPPPTSATINLKKEYIRFCKLYSSEPLDIVAAPLEKASCGRDSLIVDLRGRGLRGVDCIAIGKILAIDAPITQLILSDCLLLPQGFQALMDGLSKNTRLQILELRGNNIQTTMVSSLAKFLKANSHLQKLMLEWNSIGTCREQFSTVCESLRINEGLIHLDLRNNQIGPECATDLASALCSNKTLKELDLRWNSIGLGGAKGIWETLRVNFTLLKVHLCGNYIPEEVVCCIEDCLKQKSEREAMMEEYAQRTTLLTRQLQKTEKLHQSEINTIVSVFDAEEAELKEAIKESHQQIIDMDERMKSMAHKNHTLTLNIEKLEASLECAHEKEETLRKALDIKDEHSAQMETLLREEMDKIKKSYESRLAVIEGELESSVKEKQELVAQLSIVRMQAEAKSNELSDWEERVEVMKKEMAEYRKSCEARVKAEKEKWNQWKEEIESAEKREIHVLEEEIKEIQSKMMEHIKTIEKGKADADAEVHRLKMSFVTQQAAGEEELNKLRLRLKSDHAVILDSFTSQAAILKEQIDKHENDSQKQNALIKKLENENAAFSRHNESFRQQMADLEKELNDKESATHSALARCKAELKEKTEQLETEEESNKTLRAQVHEFQEQIATLSLRQNREIQEKFSEMDHLKTQVERREDELARLKEEDMRRAALLHEAFLAYMRSTSAATGIPLPPSYYSGNIEYNLNNISAKSGTGDAPAQMDK